MESLDELVNMYYRNGRVMKNCILRDLIYDSRMNRCISCGKKEICDIIGVVRLKESLI